MKFPEKMGCTSNPEMRTAVLRLLIPGKRYLGNYDSTAEIFLMVDVVEQKCVDDPVFGYLCIRHIDGNNILFFRK